MNPFSFDPGQRLTVWKTWSFDAAHRLPNVPQGHKCGHLHGHTYVVTIHVRGPIDPQRGWVIDYADIDAIWQKRIHAVLDHRDLNLITPNPTCELLAHWIAWTFRNHLPAGVELVRVEVRETATSGVTLEV